MTFKINLQVALFALLDPEDPWCQVHPADAHLGNICDTTSRIISKIFTAESSYPLSNVTWLSTNACGSWITLRASKQYIESNLSYKPIMNFHVSLDWFMRVCATYIHAYRPLSTCNAWFSSEALITNTQWWYIWTLCINYIITAIQRFERLTFSPGGPWVPSWPGRPDGP